MVGPKVMYRRCGSRAGFDVEGVKVGKHVGVYPFLL